MPISVCAYMRSAHVVLRVCMTGKWAAHACRKNALNAGNNQLTIVCAFSFTETCRFCGSTTRTHERFLWSKWRTRYSLPFSCACLRVVIAGRILVPAPATWLRDACILIMGRMHANYDTETVTCMCGLNDGEICFTSINVVFNPLTTMR